MKPGLIRMNKNKIYKLWLKLILYNYGLFKGAVSLQHVSKTKTVLHHAAVD